MLERFLERWVVESLLEEQFGAEERSILRWQFYSSICSISLYRVVSATWLGVRCRTNIYAAASNRKKHRNLTMTSAEKSMSRSPLTRLCMDIMSSWLGRTGK